MTFTPTVAWLRNFRLTVIDDSATSPHVVNLTGTGVQPVSLSAPAWFGSVARQSNSASNLRDRP